MRAAAFRSGLRSCAPIATGVIPFAVVVAATASDVGLSALATIGLSLVVFAGAAQLAALELARSDAPSLFIVGAAVVVNLRFAMYSASLARHMRELPRSARALMAYLLTDQAFALTVEYCEAGKPHGAWFFVGAGTALWVAWQVGTLLGVGLGASLPAELSLDFAVALAFIALVVPSLRSRSAVLAASASVGVFLLTRSLPYGLALLPAAAAGITTGALSDRLSA